MSTTFVLSKPKDVLEPKSDHRSITPLFFSEALNWHQAILGSRLSFKFSCHTFYFTCKEYVRCVIKYHVDGAVFHARYSLQHMIHIIN